MRDAFAKVALFHKTYGQPAPDAPTLITKERVELRRELIHEEFDEYIDAVDQGDITKIADALADLSYVVIGTAVEHGLTRFGEMFAEVQRSNMSKLGADGKPIFRDDGKVLKGPNFTPPDLTPYLAPLPRFSSTEWFNVPKGRVAIVACDKERPRGNTGLVGHPVEIDGVMYRCIGVESHMPATPIAQGELIGLLVEPA